MSATHTAYWVAVFVAIGAYVGVNLCLVRTIMPRPMPEGCSRWARAAGHWAPQAAVLLGILMLVQLVVAPLVLAAAAVYWLLVINNKKMAMLREPLLPSDVVMTLRHPHNWRLLARYVRRDRWTIVFTLAGAAAVIVGCVCEPWMLGRYMLVLALFSPIWLVAVFAPLHGDSLMVRLLAAIKLPFLCWTPQESVALAGFFPTFLRLVDDVPRPAVRQMGFAEAEAILAQGLAPKASPNAPPGRKPHLVVVLSEGFFNPRSAGLAVEPDPLPNLVEACRLSAYSGLCWVPVYGGWTTRSEYSFLAGVSMSCLAGIVGNPYATLLCGQTHTLPKYLRTQGYRTVMIHPGDPRFYERDNACGCAGIRRIPPRGTFRRRSPRTMVRLRRGRGRANPGRIASGDGADVSILRDDREPRALGRPVAVAHRPVYDAAATQSGQPLDVRQILASSPQRRPDDPAVRGLRAGVRRPRRLVVSG